MKKFLISTGSYEEIVDGEDRDSAMQRFLTNWKGSDERTALGVIMSSIEVAEDDIWYVSTEAICNRLGINVQKLESTP